MISSLKRVIQSRKGKLLTYLSNYSDELTLEKQHQIYGAINELDYMVEVLESQKKSEKELAVNPEGIFLFRPIHGQGFFKDIMTFLKDFF